MKRQLTLAISLWLPALAAFSPAGRAANAPATPADQELRDYFRAETAKLSGRCLADLKTLDDWTARRAQYRAQLFEMLSLSPRPPRGGLQPVVTGQVEHESFTVEKLHFQPLPHLYVTANLYLPKGLAKPAPTILYLCGHGPVITNGVSYGNKVYYQHHGAWFARHGYVCLLIDTLQLGEIQGLHHGTHREGMWWWNSRGYTPAGVEAWNSLRALDYLSTRPEVDTNRFGVTGRSGGGSYSWTLAALDERVKAAAPVAGLTDLQNHVVDGVVEGHCDCMFTVNTYRWDYPQLAALVAPRPLLLVNSDADNIFPLDGVQRTHAKLRRLYDLYGAKDKLGLVISPGPHKDTQDLQVPVFRWFNKHLKGEDPVIEAAATKFFTPEQLKVFATLPSDAINTNIHETFVRESVPAPIPKSKEEWSRLRDEWLRGLKEKVFLGWPETPGPLRLEERFNATRDHVRLQAFDFESGPDARLRLYCMMNEAEAGAPAAVTLFVAGETDWPFWLDFMRARFAEHLAGELGQRAAPSTNTNANAAALRLVTDMLDRRTALVVFAPRGVGLNAWSGNERTQAHIRRRFMLLGQTLDGMRVWDIRRAVQALRSLDGFKDAPLRLRGRDAMAGNVLFASLFEPGLARLDLAEMPRSLRAGPDYLNALRFLDAPQALALASEHGAVRLHQTAAPLNGWEYPARVARGLGWDVERFTVTELLPAPETGRK